MLVFWQSLDHDWLHGTMHCRSVDQTPHSVVTVAEMPNLAGEEVLEQWSCSSQLSTLESASDLLGSFGRLVRSSGWHHVYAHACIPTHSLAIRISHTRCIPCWHPNEIAKKDLREPLAILPPRCGRKLPRSRRSNGFLVAFRDVVNKPFLQVYAQAHLAVKTVARRVPDVQRPRRCQSWE